MAFSVRAQSRSLLRLPSSNDIATTCSTVNSAGRPRTALTRFGSSSLSTSRPADSCTSEIRLPSWASVGSGSSITTTSSRSDGDMASNDGPSRMSVREFILKVSRRFAIPWTTTGSVRNALALYRKTIAFGATFSSMRSASASRSCPRRSPSPAIAVPPASFIGRNPRTQSHAILEQEFTRSETVSTVAGWSCVVIASRGTPERRAARTLSMRSMSLLSGNDQAPHYTKMISNIKL